MMRLCRIWLIAQSQNCSLQAQDLFSPPPILPMTRVQTGFDIGYPGDFTPAYEKVLADNPIAPEADPITDASDPVLLGTIASNRPNRSVASFSTGCFFLGGKVGKYDVYDIQPKRVFLTDGVTKFFLVPGDSLSGVYTIKAPTPVIETKESPVEVVGDTVLVTRRYVDHLINDKLSEILMQVTATPVARDGVFSGVEFSNITPASPFEKLGFQNGDTITSLDGVKLTGVSQAISLLKSLKEIDTVRVDVIRFGSARTLTVKIQ